MAWCKEFRTAYEEATSEIEEGFPADFSVLGAAYRHGVSREQLWEAVFTRRDAKKSSPGTFELYAVA